MSPIKFQIQPLNAYESELHERALAGAKEYLSAEAQLLEIIMEVDASKLFHKFDLNSTFQYCVKMLKLSEAVTCNFINVARKSKEVPALKQAIDHGEISISTARKIVPILTPANHEEWITKAQTLTRANLERELLTAAPEKVAKDHHRIQALPNSLVRLELYISEETYRKFLRAQELESQSRCAPADPAQVLDGLVTTYLEVRDPIKKAERAQRRKHLSRDRSAGVKKAKPTRRTPDPRYIPAAIDHQVNLRDRGRCRAFRADGGECGETRFVQKHHIVPVAEGGKSEVDNLVTLCSTCHSRWHLWTGAS